ncbi:hypothetical protein [Embleya sp. NPDC001921]
MPREAIQAVVGSVFPELRRLDIRLGIRSYGGNATVEDLAGILDGAGLPALTHLGLMDSEISDGIATALASAPIVARLECGAGDWRERYLYMTDSAYAVGT